MQLDRNVVDCFSEFLSKPPRDIGFAVIHMSRATEREANIVALETALGVSVTRLEAVDGATEVATGHPRGCPFTQNTQRLPGEVGCLMSHVKACRWALEEGYSHLVLFEDDCVASDDFSLISLQKYLKECADIAEKFGIEGVHDFLLLSTSGCYKFLPLTARVKITTRFNGAHALLLSRDAMIRYLKVYEYTRDRGFCIPADHLYSFMSNAYKMLTLCPADDTKMFRQNRDTGSYVLDTEGKILRTD